MKHAPEGKHASEATTPGNGAETAPRGRIDLPPFDEKLDAHNVIVDTPRGSRNKYAYDETTGLWTLGKLLPAGMSFPHDFGFIPGTRGGDGDPLDVLVLADEGTFVGCWIRVRLVGVVKLEQKQRGKTERNDRVLAVPIYHNRTVELESVADLDAEKRAEIQHFLVAYHALDRVHVTLLGTGGPDEARAIVEMAMQDAAGSSNRRASSRTRAARAK